MRNVFRLERENKVNKDIILRNVKNLFENEEEKENYYKPARASIFLSNTYI